MPTQIETLGPAERILQTLLTYQDHLVHNRPGVVTNDRSIPYGKKWTAATHKIEGTEKVAYTLVKVGKKTVRTRLGTVNAAGVIDSAGSRVGEYRDPGLFPEAVAWVYTQCAEVWNLDNEFAAKWASRAFGEEHKDLKVILCALMLAQGRKGDRVGELRDVDYRDIGEAMALLRRKDGRDLSPKLLLRVGDVLALPAVAAKNRELGFGYSLKNPHLGRYPNVVEKWLRHREDNPGLLTAAVKAGWSDSIKALARRVGYKPTSAGFFKVLRWKQSQSKDGRRSLMIGEALEAADTWQGKTETTICRLIMKEKPSWKQITGKLPAEVGVTRAIISAAIEAGSLSNPDLVIMTPTLEELGLLGDDPKTLEKGRWQAAVMATESLRVANIAQNVKTSAVVDTLKAGADAALKKAAEEVTKGMRVYCMLDISGSMQGSIEEAKAILPKLLAGMPLDRLCVSVFNSVGRPVHIAAPTQDGVNLALAGFKAAGGTSHASGIFALQSMLSPPKEDEDSILIVVGDGGESFDFADAVNRSGLRPSAIGFVQVAGENGGAVDRTAARLGIPCFAIDRRTFEGTYEVPRLLRNMIAATPVKTTGYTAAPKRLSLVEAVLATTLLQKPAWALASGK